MNRCYSSNFTTNKNSTTIQLFCVNLIIQIFIYTLRKKHFLFFPQCAITGFFPDSIKQHTILLYTCTPPRENKDRLQYQSFTQEKKKWKPGHGTACISYPSERQLFLPLESFKTGFICNREG